jgi:hypothetical protein
MVAAMLMAVKRDNVGSLVDGLVIIAVMSPPVLVPVTKSK